MKKILFVIVAFAAFTTVSAQKKGDAKKFTFGVGPALSIPAGSFGDSYSIGYGVEVEGILNLSSSFEGFAQVGYSSFTGKSFTVGTTSFKPDAVGFIPALVGARYNGGGFVGGIGLGYGSFSGSGSSGGFAFSPQAGYSSSNYEILAHYTSVATSGSSTGFFGVKAFYKF